MWIAAAAATILGVVLAGSLHPRAPSRDRQDWGARDTAPNRPVGVEVFALSFGIPLSLDGLFQPSRTLPDALPNVQEEFGWLAEVLLSQPGSALRALGAGDPEFTPSAFPPPDATPLHRE